MTGAGAFGQETGLIARAAWLGATPIKEDS